MLGVSKEEALAFANKLESQMQDEQEASKRYLNWAKEAQSKGFHGTASTLRHMGRQEAEHYANLQTYATVIRNSVKME